MVQFSGDLRQCLLGLPAKREVGRTIGLVVAVGRFEGLVGIPAEGTRHLWLLADQPRRHCAKIEGASPENAGLQDVS